MSREPQTRERHGALIALTLLTPALFLYERTLHSLNDETIDGLGLFLVASVLYLATYALGLWVLARGAWRRRWPDCLLAVVALLLTWKSFGLIYAGAGDAMHVWLKQGDYRREIDAHPGQDVFRFPWGDHARFVTDGLMDETLVYDRTDKTRANIDKRMPSPLQGSAIYTDHVFGHFYLEIESR